MQKYRTGKYPITFLVLLILLVTAVLSAIAGSTALYKQEDKIDNYVYHKEYNVNLIDIFDNNGLALPGDTLNKDVSMRNDGELDTVVRVQLTPNWNPATDDLGNVLSTDVVTIGFGSTVADDWTLIDGWYYYNRVLKPGEETSLLVDSLKLEAFSNDSHNTDYSDSIYSLDVVGESVQPYTAATLDYWGVTFTSNADDTLNWTN